MTRTIHAYINGRPVSAPEGSTVLQAARADINLNVIEEMTLAALPGYKRSFAGFNTQEELARLTE